MGLLLAGQRNAPPTADRPPAVSFVGDTHLLNHARIFGELLARHDTKLLGRAATHGETQFFKLAPNFWIADRFQDFGIQPGEVRVVTRELFIPRVVGRLLDLPDADPRGQRQPWVSL